MPHWTFHDLRTTFTTLACEKLGVDAAVADRILNHVASATTSKIMRVYNKSELFEQRRSALFAWESLVREQVIGEETGTVVQIQAARA
jgi:integrase